MNARGLTDPTRHERLTVVELRKRLGQYGIPTVRRQLKPELLDLLREVEVEEGIAALVEALKLLKRLGGVPAPTIQPGYARSPSFGYLAEGGEVYEAMSTQEYHKRWKTGGLTPTEWSPGSRVLYATPRAALDALATIMLLDVAGALVASNAEFYRS